MKKKVNIGKNPPHPLYVPMDLVREGFVGQTWLLINARTATIVHPGATLEEIQQSLEIIIEDIKLRVRSKRSDKLEE